MNPFNVHVPLEVALSARTLADRGPARGLFHSGSSFLVFSDTPVMIRRPRSHRVESNATVETTRPSP